MSGLTAIAVIALFPVGLKVIAGDGMILSAFGRFAEEWIKVLPAILRKPLWTCEKCMCSLYGIPAAIGVAYGPWWLSWPLMLVSAIGLQDLMDR